MITQRTKLNLIPGAVLPRINVTQYDYGSRTLQFEIWDGNQRYTLTSGTTAQIQGTKPDRLGFEYAATVDTTNNIIVANLTQQMTAAYGDATCELVLLKTGKRIGTLNFVMCIQPAALNDETVISDSELPDIIAEATAQMEAAAQSAREASQSADSASGSATAASGSASSANTNALKAEGFAVGKQNGTAVASGSPYYHNNAEYYKDQAASSATTASSAADRAEAYSVNVPYIGANGNWWVWNATQGAYVDSGVDASITVDIEDITMLAPDATPYVTNTGTDTDPVFHLFIPRGKGISSITKTSTSGLVDTYTITYSDATTTTFAVTNGNGISAISKTSTSGLVDTYTISYTNGTSTTYTVTNGKPAYQAAVEGGYPGTEQEFNDALGNFESLAQSATTSAQNALASAQAAAGSATTAHQEYLDAKAQADRAQVYADFIEPHFVIQNNRLYIKDDAVGEFIVANNRLYMKLSA